MPTEYATAQAPARNLRTLGVLWVIYGIIRLLVAVWLVSFSSTATLMFGALLPRVPNPFALMSDFHFIYSLLIILSVICGIVSILAGIGMLAGSRSARTLGVIAAFLSLSEMPLGIALGVYTLIIFLSSESRR